MKKNFHPDKLERMFGDNPGTYVETLVGYVQNEDKKCYLVDQEEENSKQTKNFVT
ncbi:MAG: hypothetical protein R3B55_01170 [Candidatus Paceibacterota bacterium]